MEYKEVLRKKSKILCYALLGSIILRCIANAPFVGIGSVIPMGAAGIVVSVVLFILASKINPVAMMYVMSTFMTILASALMMMWPCTTNYMMFYLAMFMVIIYEDIRAIIYQSVLAGIGMVFFFFKFSQRLAESWSVDAMIMCLIYLASGMFVFVALSKMTKDQFNALERTTAESNQAREKAESLLGEIAKTVGVLDRTSGKINESVVVTEEISKQIAVATEDMARNAAEEVTAAEAIKKMVQNGVDEIQKVSSASISMTEISNATNVQVAEGGGRVSDLNIRMNELSNKMDAIAEAIVELNTENQKIVQILDTLDEITSQTNLLSLNASIEAARAGEHGKGFAVVASEIRGLSETSSQFTDQIHDILNGVEEKMKQVTKEIRVGQESVHECEAHVQQVDSSFNEILSNSAQILSQATNIEGQSNSLKELLENTFIDVSNISDNVESTSFAMEEISSSITDLNGNINMVVSGYNDINDITNSLVEVAEQE